MVIDDDDDINEQSVMEDFSAPVAEQVGPDDAANGMLSDPLVTNLDMSIPTTDVERNPEAEPTENVMEVVEDGAADAALSTSTSVPVRDSGQDEVGLVDSTVSRPDTAAASNGSDAMNSILIPDDGNDLGSDSNPEEHPRKRPKRRLLNGDDARESGSESSSPPPSDDEHEAESSSPVPPALRISPPNIECFSQYSVANSDAGECLMSLKITTGNSPKHLPVDLIIMVDARGTGAIETDKAKVADIIKTLNGITNSMRKWDRLMVLACADQAETVVDLRGRETKEERDIVRNAIRSNTRLGGTVGLFCLQPAIEALRRAGLQSRDGKRSVPVGVLVVTGRCFDSYALGNPAFDNTFVNNSYE